MEQHPSSRIAGITTGPRRRRSSLREERHPNSVTAPPISRGSMAPRPWRGFWPGIAGALRPRRGGAPVPDSGTEAPEEWQLAARRRRLLFAALTLISTIAASWLFASAQPDYGNIWLEFGQIALFAVLSTWVVTGFVTALMGFYVSLRGDPHALSAAQVRHHALDARTRTAIIMPICNEDVSTVFAGLRATCESVAATGPAGTFDVFVLSDTSDPATAAAERRAWEELRIALAANPQQPQVEVYYRLRQRRTHRKAGNVADFCRRWGRDYRYMIVLDADSVMSGDCILSMVKLMEAHPRAGIIQTATQAIGHATLHARAQQFASRVTGRLFTLGMQFWQLGESHYWGHNAILRVQPFMQHCALAPIPGRGGMAGPIMSHDFVEAALMRRAGYQVWLVSDLTGSYEQQPPDLLSELQRDRRWCQGNLMNARLFLMKGLNPAHRAVFMTGVMAYLSAPLWFLQLLLATALLAVHTLKAPQYFVEPYQIFPLWPEYRPERAIALFSTTAVLLFLPKIAAAFLIALRGAVGYGGRLRLLASMFVEMIISALLAPIRMLFHTEFVLSALFGWHIQWKSPPRTDAQTSWTEAFWRHGWHTTMGMVWAGLVYWLNPSFLWWLLPVVGALILSIPISVYTSRVSLGRALRRASYFLIPEEVSPPAEIRRAYELARDAAPLPGFEDAAMHPVVNAIACASGAPRIALAHDAASDIVQKAHASGIQSLDDDERSELLRRPVALSGLHLDLWSTPLPNGATEETPANGGDCTASAESAIHAPVLQHTRPS